MCSRETETPVTEQGFERTEPAIRVTGLSKRYRIYRKPSDKLVEALWNTFIPRKKRLSREFWALRDVDLEVPRGTTMGIIGRNGAGKSTLLQIITGVLQPTTGKVEVNGRVAALLELGAGFNREFTGRENVYLQGAVMGITRKEMQQRFQAIEMFADIGDFIDQPVKTYSSGMYVRLAFAVAINVDPDILIVDEALAVGDDMFRRRCFRRLEEFQQDGKTILFVTHSMQSIISLCSRALLIESGRLLFAGESKFAVYRYHELLASLEEREQSDWKPTYGFPPRSEADVELQDLAEHRYGNGGAQLLKVAVEDHEGRPTDVLTAGNPFVISLQVVFCRATPEPSVGFTIKTLKGVEVYGTSTHIAEKPIGPASKGEVLTVRFRQQTALAPDSYSLSAAVAEIEQGSRIFQDRRLDLLTFKVLGTRRTFGLVDLESEIDTQRSVMDPSQHSGSL